MSAPLFSIIMPSYNSAPIIETAIESFLEQEHEAKELIIVDGKSKDGTHDIIKTYCEQYSNIHWVIDTDKNVTDGINIGIRHCKGEFIGFLMTDDRYCDTGFLKEVATLSKYMEFDVVYSNTYYYYTIGDKKTIHYYRPQHKLNRMDMLINGSSVAIIDSMLIRKKVFQENSLDPSYNLVSDYEFLLRIADDRFLFFYLDRYTACCNYNGKNLSSANIDTQLLQFSEVVLKLLLHSFESKDVQLYNKISIKKLGIKKEELSDLEGLLLKLIKANSEKRFYDIAAFNNFMVNLWISVNKRSFPKNRSFYQIYSSQIINYTVRGSLRTNLVWFLRGTKKMQELLNI